MENLWWNFVCAITREYAFYAGCSQRVYKSGEGSMTEPSEKEKISAIQFDLFWMSVEKHADTLLMTIDQLKEWSKTVWDKSREMFQSENGKKGGLVKGDCKKRNQDDPDYYKKIRAKRKDKLKENS